MPTGAAGEDEYLLRAAENALGFGTEEAGLQALGSTGHFEGVGQRIGLLEDFLLHVVIVGTQLDGVGRELGFDHRTLDGSAIDTGNAMAGTGDLGAVAVVEIDHAAGNLQQGGRIRGGIGAVIGETEQQRRAFTCDDDAAGVVFAHDGQRVGALQFGKRRADGIEEIGNGLQLPFDEVRDDFGVGIGSEDIAFGLQCIAQGFMVFNDAVMHDGEAAGDVRVGITLRGNAVCGPAGVGNASAAGG